MFCVMLIHFFLLGFGSPSNQPSLKAETRPGLDPDFLMGNSHTRHQIMTKLFYANNHLSMGTFRIPHEIKSLFPKCPESDPSTPGSCEHCRNAYQLFLFGVATHVCKKEEKCGRQQILDENCRCSENHDPAHPDDSCHHINSHQLNDDDFECDPVAMKSVHAEEKKIMTQNPRLCAIISRNINFKECDDVEEKIQYVTFVMTEKRIIYDHQSHLIFYHDKKDINRYECLNVKNNRTCDEEVNQCKRGLCKGDETYLQNFGGTGLKACYCSITDHIGAFKVRLTDKDNKVEKGLCYGRTLVKTAIKRHRIKRARRALEDGRCDGCEFECYSGGIVINSPVYAMKGVEVTLPDYLYTSATGDNTVVCLFSPEMLSGPSDVKFKVFFSNGAKYESQIRCENFDQCAGVRGTFNWSFPLLFHCLSIQMIGATMLAYSSAIGILFVLVISFWCLKNIFQMIWAAYVAASFGGRVIAKGYNKGKTVMRSVVNKLRRKEKDDVLPSHNAKTTPRSKLIIPTKFLLSSLLFLTLLPDVTCDLTYVVTVPMSRCSYEKGVLKDCKQFLSNELVIPTLGQTSNLVIKGPSDVDLGFVSVRNEGLNKVCNPTVIYYSPGSIEFSGTQKSVCYTGGDACTAAGCFAWKGPDPAQGSSLSWCRCLYRQGAQFPYTECYDGSECFYIVNKFNIKGEIYSIARCLAWIDHMVLEICTEFKGEERKCEKVNIAIDGDVILWGGKMTLELKGEIAPVTPDMGMCFMDNPAIRDNYAMLECNDRGIPTLGKVGEIQCPDLESAYEINDRCIMNKGVIEWDAALNSIFMHRMKNLDLAKVFDASRTLPYANEYYTLTGDMKEMVMNFRSHAKAVITIITEEISFTALDSTFSCEVKPANGTAAIQGCYSCYKGTEFVVEHKSYDGEGYATLDCGEGHSWPLTMTLKGQTTILRPQFSKPHYKLDCKMKCPKNEVSFSVDGPLVSSPIDDPFEVDDAVVYVDESGINVRWGLFFDRFIAFLSMMWDGFLGLFDHLWFEIIIIIILAIVILSIIIYVYWKLFVGRYVNLVKKII